MAQLSRALALVATLGLLGVAVQANPAGYASGPYESVVVPDATNTTYTLFQDLQTFTAAAAQCETYEVPSTMYPPHLASVANAAQWDAVTSLTENFWSDPASIAANYSTAPASFTLGFKNPTLFEGCVWLGMTNLHPSVAHEELTSIDSIKFVDGTPLSDYVTNIRNPVPVAVTGWPSYGKSSDLYATCAMYCPTPSAAQVALGYSQIMLADCTTVALPYICMTKLKPVAAIATGIKLPEVGDNTGGAGVTIPGTATVGGATASTPAAHAPAPGGHRKMLSTAPSVVAAHDTVADTSHAAASTWPITPELVPTVLGVNASCTPYGAFSYCVFPSNVKLSQADWMAVCWQAGLSPLSIESYAELVTMLSMTQPSGVTQVFTQTASASSNGVLSNLYAPDDFLRYYQVFPAKPTNGVDVAWTWSNNVPNVFPVQLRAYTSVGMATTLPSYSFLEVNDIANPTGLQCGPTGYGLGCASSIEITSGTGRPAGLTTIQGSTLASSMCKKPNDKATPRPYGTAVVEVSLLMKFRMTTVNVDALVGDTVVADAFVAELAKLGMPAALPGLSPADVIVPLGGAIAKFYPPDLSHLELGELGVMVVLVMPWPVNTTALVTNYLKGLTVTNGPMTLLPQPFLSTYHITGAVGLVTAMTGNTDSASGHAAGTH
ncbi:hypothetical protein FOA52_013347 [Chlamydomonas sp. UWO 241]|nr:hypothetical protein FOA52_013347 [Chlamydomonas sp. UWO 241]